MCGAAINISYNQSVISGWRDQVSPRHDATQLSTEDINLHNTIFYIRSAFLPIIVIGTLLNIFNFIVLTRKSMRRRSITVYLLGLSSADLSLMYVELFRIWYESLSNVNEESSYMSDIYCKFANYTNGIARDFSNWLIACLTIERLVAVSNVRLAKIYCTVKTARKVTLILFGVLCVVHGHHLIFSKVQKVIWRVCWEDPDSPMGSVLWALVNICFGYTVVVVVFVLNVILIVVLKNYRRCHPNHWVRYKPVTKMLVLISSVFLLCETPKTIVEIIFRFQRDEQKRNATNRLILNTAFVISGVNHACNFIIYILSSTTFRQIFLQTCSKCKMKCLSVVSKKRMVPS